MKNKLEAVKKFLAWLFSEKHWKKTCVLLAILIIGAMFIFKDCYIKTNKIEIRTDTKIDAEKVKGRNVPPTDFPPHR